MTSRGWAQRLSVGASLSLLLALAPGHVVSQGAFGDDEYPEMAVVEAKLSPALMQKALRGDGPYSEEMVDVVVTLRSTAAARRGFTFASGLGAFERRSYSSLPFKAMRVPARKLPALAGDPNVSFVSPDSIVTAASESARQTARVPGSTPALNTPNTAFSGRGITVAILDSGVSLHCDYMRSPVWQLDFVNGLGGLLTDPLDGYGHGTHVAGMVAGDGYCSENAKYQGVATQATVVSLRVLDSLGRGRLSDVLAALDWVVYPARPSSTSAC